MTGVRVATVVRAERPTSAKPGDTALVLADGTLVGFVGGECAETSVRTEALTALVTGEPVLLHISPDPSIAAGAGTVTVHNPCLSGGSLDIFLEPSVPAPLVVVHGNAPIARASSTSPPTSGGTGRPRRPTESSEDAGAVVVASHGRDEAAVLEAAVQAGVPYVGLVASRRGSAVVAALALSDDERAATRPPAGLDIGAAVDGSLHVDLDDGTRVWFCGSGCRDASLAR